LHQVYPATSGPVQDNDDEPVPSGPSDVCPHQDDHADDDEGDNDDDGDGYDDDADDDYNGDNDGSDDDDGAPPKMMRSRHCLLVLEDVNSDGDAPPGQVDDSSSISLCGVCCYSVCLAFLWNQLLVSLRQLYSSLSISVLEEFRVRRFAVIQDDIRIRQIRAITAV